MAESSPVKKQGSEELEEGEITSPDKKDIGGGEQLDEMKGEQQELEPLSLADSDSEPANVHAPNADKMKFSVDERGQGWMAVSTELNGLKFYGLLLQANGEQGAPPGHIERGQLDEWRRRLATEASDEMIAVGQQASSSVDRVTASLDKSKIRPVRLRPTVGRVVCAKCQQSTGSVADAAARRKTEMFASPPRVAGAPSSSLLAHRRQNQKVGNNNNSNNNSNSNHSSSDSADSRTSGKDTTPDEESDRKINDTIAEIARSAAVGVGQNSSSNTAVAGAPPKHSLMRKQNHPTPVYVRSGAPIRGLSSSTSTRFPVVNLGRPVGGARIRPPVATGTAQVMQGNPISISRPPLAAAPRAVIRPPSHRPCYVSQPVPSQYRIPKLKIVMQTSSGGASISQPVTTIYHRSNPQSTICNIPSPTTTVIPPGAQPTGPNIKPLVQTIAANSYTHSPTIPQQVRVITRPLSSDGEKKNGANVPPLRIRLKNARLGAAKRFSAGHEPLSPPRPCTGDDRDAVKLSDLVKSVHDEPSASSPSKKRKRKQSVRMSASRSPSTPAKMPTLSQNGTPNKRGSKSNLKSENDEKMETAAKAPLDYIMEHESGVMEEPLAENNPHNLAPGDVVWAKMKGEPYWPAVIFSFNPGAEGCVIWLPGSNQHGFVSIKNAMEPFALMFSKRYVATRKVRGFQQAVVEALKKLQTDKKDVSFCKGRLAPWAHKRIFGQEEEAVVKTPKAAKKRRNLGGPPIGRSSNRKKRPKLQFDELGDDGQSESSSNVAGRRQKAMAKRTTTTETNANEARSTSAAPSSSTGLTTPAAANSGTSGESQLADSGVGESIPTPSLDREPSCDSTRWRVDDKHHDSSDDDDDSPKLTIIEDEAEEVATATTSGSTTSESPTGIFSPSKMPTTPADSNTNAHSYSRTSAERQDTENCEKKVVTDYGDVVASSSSGASDAAANNDIINSSGQNHSSAQSTASAELVPDSGKCTTDSAQQAADLQHQDHEEEDSNFVDDVISELLEFNQMCS